MKSRIQWVAVVSGLALCLTACTHVHDFGDWVTVQEATCTEDGQRYHVCYTCGETVYAVIPAAHEYVEDVCRICGFGAASVPVTTASAEVTFHYPGSTTPTTTTPPTDVATTVTTTTTAPTTQPLRRPPLSALRLWHRPPPAWGIRAGP